ncbi:3-phytase B [Wickerhamiella sorbophila]|uniref:3-phytase B n=1 Tax=Wickerhamiella sorbophila TaxID=45607 RepID=A0A2T0FHU4_9ASCO|nr:3-phytase B [Wickerhamiella sorbophila]PRT54564.1 3-phytase B [Wickerhamiella sorbophila]
MYQQLLLAAAIMTGAEAAYGRTFSGSAAYPQTQDEFNPLKYTGTLGPYTQRSGVGISTDAPAGCKVEQVVLFARHGAHYPTSDAIDQQKDVLKKITKDAPKSGFSGSLSFLNNYEYFLSEPGYANLEIPSGPYSGLAGSYQFGAEFAGKYGNLWDSETLPIFSDNAVSGLESARAFGQGLLAFNYSTSAAVNTYTLDACSSGKLTKCSIKTNTTNGLPENNLRYPAFEVAALRLSKENRLNLTADDVFDLLSLASSEVAAKGSSPWVDVFTTDEWIAFEYAMDAFTDCYYGSQSPRALALGAVFANATAELLKNGPEQLPLALVFGQGSELTGLLAALGLATPSERLDPKKISFSNFRVSDVAPMGARFVIERLNCQAPGLSENTDLITSLNCTSPMYLNGTLNNATYPNNTNTQSGSSNSTQSGDGTFVRFILNDAVIPWHECYDGPGFTCALDNFLDIASDKVQGAAFKKVCGADPTALSIFNDYSSATTLNTDTQPVPYQGQQN